MSQWTPLCDNWGKNLVKLIAFIKDITRFCTAWKLCLFILVWKSESELYMPRLPFANWWYGSASGEEQRCFQVIMTPTMQSKTVQLTYHVYSSTVQELLSFRQQTLNIMARKLTVAQNTNSKFILCSYSSEGFMKLSLLDPFSSPLQKPHSFTWVISCDHLWKVWIFLI